jgi:hypothetical protein
LGREVDVHRGCAAAGGGVVHQVVVHQSAGLDQFQGADRPQHCPGLRVVGGATRSSPAPPGEGRTQPLAGAEDEVTQRIDRGDELWVDLRRLLALGLEEAGEFAPHLGAEVVIERMHVLIFR